jgi:outer membrane protein TolC
MAIRIRYIYTFLLITGFLWISPQINAQPVDSSHANNNNTNGLTLQQCIDYALQNQPALNEALINVSIARTTNAINLSGWLPQVNAGGTLTHYFQLPTTFEPNTLNPGSPSVPTAVGIYNGATPAITISQAIFSPSLIYAARSAPLYVKAARQVTDSTKINLVTTVSKTFYNLLLTLEQIDVLKSDTVELKRSVADAYHQYVGGIVDETDYEEATITLNNTLTQLKQYIEYVRPQYAALKQLMGFPPEKDFNVSYDTSKMIHDVNIDTTEQLEYQRRIEYKQLVTAKQLQHELINYYRFSFLPTVSGFYNYTLDFENNTFADMFNAAYPYSSIGLSFSMPIFTGFARLENIHKAQLQEKLLDWSEVNLKSQIYYDYASALANYKSNLYTFHVMSDNVAMAKRVYFVVELQYKQGIVAYLNVITAQSNLISSEITYVNALYNTLSSKIDLERAMGDIPY